MHLASSSYFQESIRNNYLLPDAQRLLSQAQNQLEALDPAHPGYQNLINAVNYLNSVLAADPSNDALAAAMSNLTAAMAAAQ